VAAINFDGLIIEFGSFAAMAMAMAIALENGAQPTRQGNHPR